MKLQSLVRCVDENVIDWAKQALVPTLVLPRNFG
jgi:hypothetical protein